MTDKKDIMPTNGCAKPFVGINLAKKQDCPSVDIFDTKMDSNSPEKNINKIFQLVVVYVAQMPVTNFS